MRKEYVSFGKSDREIFTSLKNILKEIDIDDDIQVNTQIGKESSPISKAYPLGYKFEHSNSFFDTCYMVFKYNQADITLSVNRENGFIKVAVNINISSNPNVNVTNLLAAMQNNFLPLERNEAYDKLLGKELAEFYRKREEGLVKLEGLSQKLIEDNETYRKKLDEEYSNNRKKLLEEFANDKASLEETIESKNKLLEEKERILEAKLKELDDRSSKHARRQIRQDLKKEIESRNKAFKLTEDTIRKRIIIHIVFVFFIIFMGAFITYSLWIFKQNPTAETNLYNNLRFLISSLGFAGTIIYYIRWNDNWFKRHADEEFNIKRFQLDIERASWVVEMAMEWKDEKGSEIQSDLIDRLTVNLFQNSTSERATHPSEDALSKILGGSTELNLDIPSIGSIKLNKKGVKELKKAINADDKD